MVMFPGTLPAFLDLGDLSKLSSPVLPLIITVLLSYSIAMYIFDIYATAIDTILLNFCEDLDVNKDTHEYFMSPELQKYLNDAKAHTTSKHKHKHKETDGVGDSKDSQGIEMKNEPIHNPVNEKSRGKKKMSLT